MSNWFSPGIHAESDARQGKSDAMADLPPGIAKSRYAA